MTTRLKDFASSSVAAVEPETSALQVSRLMRQHHIGAIVVVEAGEKNRPVGIVTDRDLVLELMSEGLEVPGLALAVGPALADKMQGRQVRTACFFGEGARTKRNRRPAFCAHPHAAHAPPTLILRTDQNLCLDNAQAR